ncbi:karyopherin Kap95 [Blastocladiella britannica]|nr:karyopherin Kap95 [Blastocladiella britannica]
MAEIVQWLNGTFSADQSIRQAAQASLMQAYESNYVSYIGLLTQEFVNPAADPSVRQAAGLALKNALSAHDAAMKEDKINKWRSIDPTLRSQIKAAILGNLDSPVGTQTAGVLAAIADIELPRGEWENLMETLFQNIQAAGASEKLKGNTVQAIGFICEQVDPAVLTKHSDHILSALMNGARKDEPSAAVRKLALEALFNALLFVEANFERTAERNIIMQVLCEGTQDKIEGVQVAAYECLIKTVDIYYKHMELYMRKALFGVTIFSMQSESDAVVLQAIEFWSTLAERENDLMAEQEEDMSLGRPIGVACKNYTREVLKDLMPVLYWLITKQEEDVDEDDWVPSMAAATCVGLLTLVVGNDMIPVAIPLIEHNIQSMEWRQRNAAVLTFGSILEGPTPQALGPLVKDALPFLIQRTADESAEVKDSAAWTLGRVCEFMLQLLDEPMRDQIAGALLTGLAEVGKPRIVSSSSWALIQFADQYGDATGTAPSTSPLSKYFTEVVRQLLTCSARDTETLAVRTGCYQALGTWVSAAPEDTLPGVNAVAQEVLTRLEHAAAKGGAMTAVDAETVANLVSVVNSLTQRLGREGIVGAADRVMAVLIQLAQVASASKATGAIEDILFCIGEVARTLDEDFVRFAEAVIPVVAGGLQHPAEHAMCAAAVGTVADMARALGPKFSVCAGGFMELLGQALTTPGVHPSVPPAIISTFGEIAMAVGGRGFEPYFETVVKVLQQAASAASAESHADALTADWLAQLRSSIIDSIVGILNALVDDGMAPILLPHMQFVMRISHDAVTHTEVDEDPSLAQSVAGLLGDIACTYGPQLRPVLAANTWILAYLEKLSVKRGFPKVRDTARWAREQVGAAQ